jgi:hypothetical protein
MPQQKSVLFRKNKTLLSPQNLRLNRPIGENSLYGQMFMAGVNIADSLSGTEPSSVWENYMSQASQAEKQFRRQPLPTAGALLMYEAARRKGIGLSGSGMDFKTKYGKVSLGAKKDGLQLKFDLDKSILGKLEQRLMK